MAGLGKRKPFGSQAWRGVIVRVEERGVGVGVTSQKKGGRVGEAVAYRSSSSWCGETERLVIVEAVDVGEHDSDGGGVGKGLGIWTAGGGGRPDG